MSSKQVIECHRIPKGGYNLLAEVRQRCQNSGAAANQNSTTALRLGTAATCSKMLIVSMRSLFFRVWWDICKDSLQFYYKPLKYTWSKTARMIGWGTTYPSTQSALTIAIILSWIANLWLIVSAQAELIGVDDWDSVG
jgi:hypothetical protein